MKATSQNIYNTIKQASIAEYFNQLKGRNPNFAYQETTLSESYDDYVRLTDLIIKTVDNNLFDSIPFTRRNQIWNSVSNIKNQLDQIKNFGYDFNNGNVVNLTNSIIQLTINLVDAVETSNLFAKSIGLEDYKDEISKLSDVRKKYQDFLTKLSELERLQNESSSIFNVLTNIQNQINELLNQANEKINSLSGMETTGKEFTQKINESSNVVKESEKEIEAKKLQITTFSQNIDEYKTKIDELTENAKAIIAKEQTINDLIRSAETALNLKSAQGISAAFSSQYDTAKDSGVVKIFWGIKLNSWIFGASLFILSAIGITVWIATGHLNSDSNGISLIIARIVAVAISITGATFCAKQYIKQRNIAEDYAYKAVLSKSIVAFTDEIKKRDEQKVAQYLTKVLDEIHKDPLRGRENADDKNIGLNATEIIEKLIDAIKKK